MLKISFPAKSGLPPRDTATLTKFGVSAAATNAAAAPVLAPNMSAGSPQLPAEEYSRIINTLMNGNDEIKDILSKYNNKKNVAAAQKEKVHTQQLIPSRMSYE